ncbi:MAG: hypothetical protein EBY93_04110 [Actinobacteria bacterium]|nr:hypothetical protein [Actinomycetota bacterium]
MSSEQQNARRGGRAARNALRAAPLSDDIKPVRPGMPSGRYKVLTDAEVLKIHEAALNVLENIGLADPIQSTLDYLLPKGCKLDSNGRLLFPRSLIEDTIAMAGRNFPLYAQDPKYDMEPWGTNTYFGTAGAAVYIADPETGDYRESTAQDAYDIARLVDRMEHLHFYQRAVVPRDIPEAAAMDINTCYLSVSGTTKHVGTSWVHPDHLISPARHSATCCTSAPAIAAGAVAPAWPAERSSTGMPASTATSRHLHASLANLSGGTTKQFDCDTKGRARHLSSPPAISCNIFSDSMRWSGCTHDVPTCLVVPLTLR